MNHEKFFEGWKQLCRHGRHFRPISKQKVKIDIFEYESIIIFTAHAYRRKKSIRCDEFV